jgi:type IV pilus assembly protein PilO
MDQLIDKYSKVPMPARWAAIVAIPFVLFAVLYFLIYDPKVKELEQKRSESQKLEKKYVENQAVADNLPQFQEEVNILNQQLDRAVTLLPNEANVHQLYKQLFVEAEKANVELLSFKPGSEGRKDFYNELSLSVRLEGTYHRIAEFIDRIGKLDRIINVSDINFSKVVLTNGDAELELTTNVTTYTFGGRGAVAPSSSSSSDDENRSRRRRRRR